MGGPGSGRKKGSGGYSKGVLQTNKATAIKRNPHAQKGAPAMYHAYKGGMAFTGRTKAEVKAKLSKR